jgi:hypothetical protein
MVDTLTRGGQAVMVEERDLAERQARLYRRLEDGYQRIESALGSGSDVTRWEELWFSLLAEYEQVSDEINLSLPTGAGR